ncbi:MAG: TRAP transporter small permease [Oscillospiraceae bacterium]|nr:TRAP transporter small permease [Oscillospiraceae bacterium]
MLKKIDSAISKFEETLSVILFLAVVLVVCWSVLCRYLLKIPFLQGEELARFLMIYIVYIGTSIGVKNKSHIGVEVFVDLIPEKTKRYVKIFTEILSAVMFAILFALSIEMLLHLIQTNQMTTTTHIPTYFVFICIPVGLLTSIVHYVYEIYSMILDLKIQEKEAKT